MGKNYFKVNNGKVIAFDVDDTLVMWGFDDDYEGPLVDIKYDGFVEKAIPNEFMIEHLKRMKRRGHRVIVWSFAGSDWAEAVVNSLGLDKYVDVIMPKLSFHMDDSRNPQDKLGRWAYIDLKGNMKMESQNGTIKEWKYKNAKSED